MYPDDRVLVSVINRKRDLNFLLNSLWYRIPRQHFEDGIYFEYLAFYLSGSAQKTGRGICYYAPRKGVELLYRRDLLPQEADHPRANDVYYKVQLSKVLERHPPITNPTKRPISFIVTTWDRFLQASVIADLYSKGDYFVDRIYHALRDNRIRPRIIWEAEKKAYAYRGAALRVICEKGTVTAYSEYTQQDENGLYLDPEKPDDDILAEIRNRISLLGGPVSLPLPPSL